MSKSEGQSFKSHARFDPLFHFFLAIVFLANVVVASIHAFRHPHFLSWWLVFLSVAALLALLKLRAYPIKVQDRVIRLEERLRLAMLLPEPLRARIPELTESQLVGLRFASDAEIPKLVERTLKENLSRKDIKKAIQNWRPDYWRV